ncbi:MAG: hypothetical protein QOD39_503 [Mycobacterium sp.]|nr:hypothetical protein [Mycobacterium sp.]
MKKSYIAPVVAGMVAAAVATAPATASSAATSAAQANPFAAAAQHSYDWSAISRAQRAAQQWTVVADHLNNPRGITATRHNVFVAEAGAGGRTCLGGGTCVGFTGAVVEIRGGVALPVVGGLVSAAGKDGTFATGSDDVAIGSDGSINIIETSAGLPKPPGLPRGAGDQLGRLLAYDDSGLHAVADVTKFEYKNDPDGQGPDSDPYGVLALGKGAFAVADAAGNDVLQVDADGTISVLAVLPNNSYGANAVPTSLALGPDGAIYVGELGGDGTPAGGARVWRIAPKSHYLSQVGSGFTDITGLGFGPDGSMYVTELTRDPTFASPYGDVVKVAPDGTRTRLGKKLVFPAGVAVDASGNVYVNNASVLPANTPMEPPFFGMHGQTVMLTQSAG